MRVIAAFLLVALPVAAKPTVLFLQWDELRAVVASPGFREKVTVRTEPGGRERVRGRLRLIDEAGLVLVRDDGEMSIARSDVHSVRLFRKRGDPFRMRALGIALMAPLWFVGVNVGFALPPEDVPEGRWWKTDRAAQAWVVSFALPAAVYWLTHRKDIKRGSFIAVVSRGKEVRR